MRKYKFFVGIDTSKATLDVCLWDGKKIIARITIKNNHTEIKHLLKTLLTYQEGVSLDRTLFCVEFTGVYNNLIYQIAAAQSWDIVVEPAVQIKKSLGIQRGKNDKVDAERIARYVYKNREEVRLWAPMSDNLNRLKALQTQRFSLMKSKTILLQSCKEDKKFITKELGKLKAQSIRGPVRELNKSIMAIDQEMNQIIKNDDELKRLNKIITSVVGIGIQNSISFLVRTNAFNDITDPRQFACYAGVAPFQYLSGSSIKGRPRVSRQANLKVKSLLQMGVLSAFQWDEELKHYYDRKVAQGKNKMSVQNAIRNKLIHRVFACVRENRLYQRRKAA